ncbi:carbohydrate porin [Belnapia sp. F-4-1]|uniref:carbohydrate porin n=1 Tax=Belnapia sp. F-4-1 TaxID=1545443 RepID=UPI0005B8EC44|nr:carbohydrate porin [Belnapia sp. F-4-1]
MRGSDRDRNRLAGTGAAVRDFEANLEVTYVAEVRPGFSLQPSITHVWHPSGDARRNALVLGLRTYLQF